MTTIYYPPEQNAIQKTLDAQLLSGITASMTLSNVTGIPNKAGVCVIDLVDANGAFTPAKREYVSYTGVSGSTLTGLTRNADGGGSDQDHAIGAIVQFPADVLQQQGFLDSYLTEHEEAGTHKAATVTTLKATGAVVNTGTSDDTIVTPKALADSAVSTASKTETLTNKTLTSPKINENVALLATSTELNKLDGSVPRKSVLFGNSLGLTIAGGTTAYVGLGLNASNWFDSGVIIVPCAGTIKNLSIYLTTVPGSGKNIVITVQKTGSDQSVTLTINGVSANSGSDYTNSFAVAQGDFINLKLVSDAGANAVAVRSWSLEFDAD